MKGVLKHLFLILVLSNAVELAFANNKVTEAFSSYDIVPDYVSTAPKCKVEVEYGCDLEVDLGNKLTTTETEDTPGVSYETDVCKYYTLSMSDPDVPSAQNNTLGEFLHWLVVNIPGDRIDDGEPIAEYTGPAPDKGTGYHRYVFLVYEQQEKMYFEEKKINYTSTDNRYMFSISAFAKKHSLGDPIDGNFFLAQNEE